MEFLKNIFGDKSLTFEDFMSALSADKNIKLVNLADGQYVDKGKLADKINELKEANYTIEKLKKNSDEVESLKQTIADYEAKEKKRTDEERAANEEKAIKDRFLSLKGNHKFLNEGTEKWIFEEFKNALSLDENKGKSDSDIYAVVTKDKNIYENPNKKYINPPVGSVANADENQRTITLMKAMGIKEKEKN